MTLPAVRLGDLLGRRVFSKKTAQKVRAGRKSAIVARIFKPEPGANAISVDRLCHAPKAQMTTIAMHTSLGRSDKFQGWAVLTVDDAQKAGRRVSAAPAAGNDFHAEIAFPAYSPEERREWLRTHTVELAASVQWEPRCQ